MAALKKFPWLYGSLAASLLFFLVKGIRYSLIGSQLPLAFTLAAFGLMGVAMALGPRAFRIMLRLWAIVLMVWALARATVGLAMALSPQVTETHIRQQFGLLNNLLTLLACLAGLFIYRGAKALKKAAQSTQ